MTELDVWRALIEVLDKRYVTRDDVDDLVDETVDERLAEVLTIAGAEAEAAA